MISRLKKIEKYLNSKEAPDIHVIKIHKYKGETKDQAVKRYETENKIDSKTKNYVYILISSDEQIRNHKFNLTNKAKL